jgi:HAD superfamily hydrolase (TIGR01549 family)
MLKAVIFDFNGVLMDDTFYIVKLYQETARENGLRIPTEKEVIGVLGLVWQEMAKKLLGDDEKYRPTLERLWKKYENETKPMPGMEKVITSLEMKKAIVTSSREMWLERVLGNLINYFDVIITHESTNKHKPDPEPLLLACKKLGIKPDEAVYIGDRIIDLETAKNAGTDFIGILSGGTSKEEFEKAGVKKIIKSLDELMKIVK